MYKLFVLVFILAVLPVLGLFCSGKPLAPYLEFPPETLYIVHATFSWKVFLSGTVVVVVLGGLLLSVLVLPADKRFSKIEKNQSQRFPVWGWIALTGLMLFWILAWTRFDWFSGFQALTFTPLWVSFIILINAHSFYRTGNCILLARPQFFVFLFVLSSLFWWYFEFLNRFVQNWFYTGIDGFSSRAYLVHSTIAFSTVLPAVSSMQEWLLSFPRFRTSRFQCKLSVSKAKPVATTVLIIASTSLFCIGIWPDYLFPLLWLSPLLVIVSLQIILNEPGILTHLQHGDWRIIYVPALAALLCGFFWELWNYYSLAKWLYFIPWVHAGQVFEMPILGYMGYLPFGLECLVITNFFSRLVSPTGRNSGHFFS